MKIIATFPRNGREIGPMEYRKIDVTEEETVALGKMLFNIACTLERTIIYPEKSHEKSAV